MLTWYCRSCLTNWAPSHAIKSSCCECRTGLIRSTDPMSDDAPERHKEAVDQIAAKKTAIQNLRDFNLYVAKRDAARDD